MLLHIVRVYVLLHIVRVYGFTTALTLLCVPICLPPPCCVCRCADSECSMEEQDFFRIADRHEPTRMGTTKVHTYIVLSFIQSCRSTYSTCTVEPVPSWDRRKCAS